MKQFSCLLVLVLTLSVDSARAQLFAVSGNSIDEYNLTTGASMGTFASGLSGVSSMAVAGNLLFVSVGTKVETYNITSGSLVDSSLVGGSLSKTGLTVTSNSNGTYTLYVVQSANSAPVEEFTVNSTGTVATTVDSSFISAINVNGDYDIVQDGADLLLGNIVSDSINEYSSTGALLVSNFATRVDGYAFAVMGSVLFVQTFTGNIEELNASTGAVINNDIISGFDGDVVSGMYVVGSDLYISNETTGKLYAYNMSSLSNPELVDTISVSSLGAIAAISAAIAAPEPASWIMALCVVFLAFGLRAHYNSWRMS